MTKKISLINDEFKETLLKEVAQTLAAFEEMRKKKKLSNKHEVYRQYCITLIDNPTPANIMLFTCGRAEDMKRFKLEESS